jgi:hypothetical protein
MGALGGNPCVFEVDFAYPGGYSNMGRPRKNRDSLLGRAGRQAIEQEDLQLQARKWKRRKAAVARLAARDDS